jgi:hypothetical protein
MGMAGGWRLGGRVTIAGAEWIAIIMPLDVVSFAKKDSVKQTCYEARSPIGDRSSVMV